MTPPLAFALQLIPPGRPPVPEDPREVSVQLAQTNKPVRPHHRPTWERAEWPGDPFLPLLCFLMFHP